MANTSWTGDMVKNRKDRRRAGTAFHEAGHAVADLAQGRGASSVSIRGDLRGTLGHARRRRRSKPLVVAEYPRHRKRIEKDIICSFAGVVAEGRHFGEVPNVRKHGGHFDYRDAIDAATILLSREDEALAFCGWLYERTVTLLCVEPYWSAVEAIAKELLAEEALGGKQVRDIYKRVCGMGSWE